MEFLKLLIASSLYKCRWWVATRLFDIASWRYWFPSYWLLENHVRIVTSAFRAWKLEWSTLPHLDIVVSIDGLQPEHDLRRAPATYDRILKKMAGKKITIHCTI